MDINELQAFIQKIKNNAGLQEALRFAQDAESVSAIGRKIGLNLSAAAMTHFPKHLESLGADELELVAGGKRGGSDEIRMASSTHINNWSTWVCGCKPN